VSRATHAIICLDGTDHFENVGKQPLQQSGKYRVNEIGEENFCGADNARINPGRIVPGAQRRCEFRQQRPIFVSVIPERCGSIESRDSPMRNCASEVWCWRTIPE
jgi:hypothetical protein